MPDILNRTVKTPAGEAPVVPILILGFGAYLTWFGVHYWRSDTAWPTDPIKAVLTGNAIPVPDRSGDEAAIKGIVQSAKSGSVTEIGAGTVVGHSPGAGPTAAVMTKDQIKALWTGNGGSPATANVAAAVALAESSGRTGPDVNTRNPDGGTNVGLWQLDTNGVGAGHTIEQLQDPATNARITIMGSANGTNWSHWEAYTSGAYQKYL
jgi:hypothetical protein